MTPDKWEGLPLPTVSFALLMGGMAALGLEILLFRMLVLRTGAFTLSLAGVTAAFLLALGLGSLVLPALCQRFRPGVSAAFLLVCGGLGAALAPHLFVWVEDLLPWHRGGTGLRQFCYPLLYGLLVGGPAAIPLGALLPILYAGAEGERPRVAAVLTLAQAGGAMAGVVLVPLVILPLLPGPSPFPWAGLLLGLITLLGILPLRPRMPGLSLVSVGGILLLVGWFPAARAAQVPPFLSSSVALPGREVVATCHDAVTVATAVYDRRVHEKLLFTDGFQAASLGEEGGYMRLLGHLPLLLHKKPERVVLVMIGTGTTLESVTRHRTPQRIDAVEISPAVVNLTRHFSGPGSSPCDGERSFLFRDDPRVHKHVTDGRRYVRDLAAARLAGRDRGADVITQEPLLPYTPAALPFYTRDYYQIVRQALAPGGVFVQWIPLGSTPPEMTRVLTATIAETFPWVSLWVFHSSALLVAGEQPLTPDPERFAAIYSLPMAAEDLRRAGAARPADLLAGFVTDKRAALLGAATLSDDRPFLEGFVRPGGGRILQWFPRAFEWVLDLRGKQAPAFVPPPTFASQGLYLRGRIREAWDDLEMLKSGAPGRLEAEFLYNAALRKDPLHRSPWTASRRYRAKWQAFKAGLALQKGEYAGARRHADVALLLRPDDAWNHLLAAAAAAGLGQVERARRELYRAAWWWPGVFSWQLYRDERGRTLKALAGMEELGALLRELTAGKVRDFQGPFRPRELVMTPGAGGNNQVLPLALAFPLQFTGALLASLTQPEAIRLPALKVIAALGDPLLVKAAALQLGDFSWREREVAAGFLSTTSYWPKAALAAMVEDPEPKVRRALAGRLGACRRREALSMLVQMLADEDAGVRSGAAIGVRAKLGSLAGYDPLGPATARAAAIKRIREALVVWEQNPGK